MQLNLKQNVESETDAMTKHETSRSKITSKSIQTSPEKQEQLPISGALAVFAGQVSSKGRKPENEDAIGIKIPTGLTLTTKGIVSVISDGVSAAEGGAKASAISVSNFIADYYSTPESWSVLTSSTRVLTALNRWLYGLGQDYRDARKGYVCTFSALVFKSCSAHMLHAGDSRIYRFRQGQLVKLSRDHSTSINEFTSYLTRALGMDVNLEVDYKQFNIELDDIYLLTTDGIHDVVTDHELLKSLVKFQQSSPLLTDDACETFCQNLVDKAYELDSGDNLSAQLISIKQLPTQAIDDVYQKLSSRPFPPPMEVGMKLDDYEVTKVLHQSQRSQVYIVQNKLGEERCMKTPSVNYIDDAAYIERFMLESWIGHRISSQHVVKVVDHHLNKSALYYLTEYLQGLSLADWMVQHQRGPVEDVLQLLKQIETGIRAFHRKETLHQDLKPDNIFITREGVVKIIDFGACHIKGIAEINTPLKRDQILGTADYTSPEVILGYQSDGRADLFSFAVIAYEMLAGEPPFKGQLAKCHSRNDFVKLCYVPVYKTNPMVPEWMDKALEKALSVEPSLRFVDTNEFIHALTTPSQTDSKTFTPFIQRNPIKFWQSTCATLLIWVMYLLLS
ncbi:bifunctional protein-serine/threonine kinase/phosphatase [Shewanella sp. 1_MG-2023]|uniref:bifunctional protein-serine/threonine kinase/phosphatase n=1 Tax=unclassified Shewanella TaxID=196818 RepID=UPI0026E39779|nr:MULTISPECIES: bifunctional protein-serine/threonine kinase/phosphatase [unclassified Shewanella]MDO6611911.1 bifunctional protein-serine/threonine kinase/phosphatase [Shewanella sp. 7_MG-2023]MDO6771766.1 bifunctional protein-serine/threonine kinase/phosphatase [Shewanella sp. 2_MG-2023]MDO6793992.1 bifunctional protein-serine/threonine kinase/phosphatase [Shewanella sp. 1_MG-2023]